MGKLSVDGDLDDGMARLSVAVIRKAIDDVRHSGRLGEDAREFLDSWRCDFWCGVAGIDFRLVRQRLDGRFVT